MLPDQRLHHRMVGAHHREAVERHVLDEGAEGLLHRLEGLEVVEMLGVDVGDDGDVGRQLQEGAVGLVGLDHHPVAGAEPRIGAVGVDDAAVDDGRIEAAGIEQRGDQRGGRGLAVRAGDRDAALQPHQLGQHLGAAHDRQALARARPTSSGLSRLIAVETTTTSASPRFAAAWPMAIVAPLSRRRLTLALSAASEPCTV